MKLPLLPRRPNPADLDFNPDLLHRIEDDCILRLIAEVKEVYTLSNPRASPLRQETLTSLSLLFLRNLRTMERGQITFTMDDLP